MHLFSPLPIPLALAPSLLEYANTLSYSWSLPNLRTLAEFDVEYLEQQGKEARTDSLALS